MDLSTSSLFYHRHLKESCSGREVSCPNPGCSEKIPLLALNWHLQAECVVEKKKKQMAEHALTKHKEDLKNYMTPSSHAASTTSLDPASATGGKSSLVHSSSSPNVLSDRYGGENFDLNATHETPISLCNQCGEPVSWRDLNEHKEKLCRFRTVCCPHAFMPQGCPVIEIPWASLMNHLAFECVVEKRKIELVKNSALRNNPIMCRMCGELVQFSSIPLHEERLCKNRLTPCRNHALGCPALFPYAEKETHESGKGVYPRYILAMNGYGNYLNLNESDLNVPWTAEFWLYRALPISTVVSSLRTIFSHLLSYEISFNSEINLHSIISHKVLVLESIKKKSHDGLSLTKEEKLYKQKKNTEFASQVIQEIKQSLLPKYSENITEYIKTFQYLAVAIEAALHAIEDIEINRPNTKASLDTKLSLKTSYLGEEIDLELDKEIEKIRKAREELLVNGGEVKTDDLGEELSPGPTQSPPPLMNKVKIPVEKEILPEVSFCEDESLQDDSTTGPQFIKKLSPFGKLLVVGKGSIANLMRQAWLQTHPNSKSIFFPKDTSMRPDVSDFLLTNEHVSLTPDISLFLSLFLANPYNFYGHFETNNTETGAAIKEMYEAIYSLPIRQIRRMLLLLSRILKSDFDYLQDLRVQAGLLVPDPNAPITHKSKGNSQRESSRIERERKKRMTSNNSGAKDVKIKDSITELLKQGCATEILMDSGLGKKFPSSICLSLFSGLNILLKPCEGEKPSPFWPEIFDQIDERKKEAEKEEAEKKKRKKKETKEEIEAREREEQKEKELQKEREKEELKKGLGGHHYDLIVNIKDFWSLRLLRGQPGIIFTELELRHKKKKDKDKDQLKDKAKDDKNNEVSTEKPNETNKEQEENKADEENQKERENAAASGNKLSFTRVLPFNTKISRGKWLHLAFVATEEPTDRVSFYMVSLFNQPSPISSSNLSLSFSFSLS